MLHIKLNKRRNLHCTIKLLPEIIGNIGILPAQQLGANSNPTHHIQLRLHLIKLIPILHLNPDLATLVKQCSIAMRPPPTLQPLQPVYRTHYVIRH